MKTATQVMLTFLLNASWQVALIAGCAGCGGVLLRAAAARYQHALWVAALLLAVGLPVFSGANQLRAAFASPPTSSPTSGHVSIRTSLDEVETGAVPGAATPIEPAPIGPLHVNNRLAFALVGLYLLFILYRMTNLFRAWRRTRTIIRSSFEVTFPDAAQLIIRECQAAFGVRKVHILCSPLVDVPITAGILNPLIILPEQLRRETDADVLTSAMGHELVHIARRDYILNLIYEIIYLPLSFHPAAAFVRRRIRSSRELCCDQRVTESLINPDVYARSLVRLIAAAPMAGRLAANTTIGITESDNLEVRIMSLLRKPSLTARRKRLLLIAASLLLLTPCLAAAKLALSFDIGKQEPTLTVTQEKEEKLARRKQEKEELKRAERELKEQAQKAPASERAEIQARLLEVQRTLAEHEKALSESYQENQIKLEKSLVELQSLQERGDRPEAEAKIAELREKLVKLESMQPADVEQMREARQKLLELYQQQSGDRKARLVHRVEPQYTEDAREKKIEGSVVLSLTVDHDGLPQNIVVKKSLYPSLDQSAVEAARKMRFEPAMKNGQPVSMTVTTEFTFSIEARSQQELEAIEKRRAEEGAGAVEAQVLELRTRKEQEGQRREGRAFRGEELTRGATISMDRAIQIATSKYPGKVLACSLGRDREGDGRVFYHVVIISGDGDKSAATYVWVSAVDGQILKSEKE